MNDFKKCLPAISIILCFFVFAVFILPFFPIDETRYLTVAWEMKLRHSFLVPFLNGAPYSHKPPFLFWMVNLLWGIIGVNEFVPRLVPLVFSILSVIMTFKIASFLFEDDEKTAEASIFILVSSFLWLIWSVLFMFDIILTFFSLFAVYQFLRAVKSGRYSLPFFLAGISMGIGIIVKGPVIFVHTLPVAILIPFLYQEADKRRWFAMFVLSIVAAAITGLAWAGPAAISGGKAYAEAILWGQTANRVVSSFAHRRAFWWYLSLLPIIFFPWGLNLGMWKSFFSPVRSDGHKGKKLLVFWFLSCLFIFSLISGKQIHYLIPELPCFAMLFASEIKNYSNFKKNNMAVVFFVLGVVLFILPIFYLGSDIGYMPKSDLFLLSFVSFCLSVLIFFKGCTSERFLFFSSLSSLIFLIIFLFSSTGFLKRYDLTDLASFVKNKEEKGMIVVHYGKYAGQYTFAGRLEKKVEVLENADELRQFVLKHNNFILVQFTKKKIMDKGIIFSHLYRNRHAIVWDRQGVINNLSDF